MVIDAGLTAVLVIAIVSWAVLRWQKNVTRGNRARELEGQNATMAATITKARHYVASAQITDPTNPSLAIIAEILNQEELPQ